MTILFSFELAVVDSHYCLLLILNSRIVIHSINGLNNVEIRANDAHGMAATTHCFACGVALNLSVPIFFSGNNT